MKWVFGGSTYELKSCGSQLLLYAVRLARFRKCLIGPSEAKKKKVIKANFFLDSNLLQTINKVSCCSSTLYNHHTQLQVAYLFIHDYISCNFINLLLNK